MGTAVLRVTRQYMSTLQSFVAKVINQDSGQWSSQKTG